MKGKKINEMTEKEILRQQMEQIKNSVKSGKVTINEIRLRHGLSKNEDGNELITTIPLDNNKEQDCSNHSSLP